MAQQMDYLIFFAHPSFCPMYPGLHRDFVPSRGKDPIKLFVSIELYSFKRKEGAATVEILYLIEICRSGTDGVNSQEFVANIAICG